ncbi:hypothetical protein HAHE_17890 [Haloferula helveola]|uniref:Spermidine synthase n=1 Tax=Haloferula helveola TaxID=490095 RepID=A0ABM7RCU3_9BACT|nr:hypothetical protein HAHE_17890 [Haloferula helveola]
MKPRVILAETTQPDGSALVLHEHDGRPYLTVDGVQTSGPSTRASEVALAQIGTSPFRPVRQPRIWIAGLGLGTVLKAALEALPQKRGVFHVAEPCAELASWHRKYLDPTPLEDKRVETGSDPGVGGLAASSDGWHAILVHADTAPLLNRKRLLHEDRRWLTAAYDHLKPGGLLAIASARPIPKIESNLGRTGFEVIRHQVDAVPNARRPRHHFLWLARKGKSDDA